ncbi:HutD family protein [Porticoccaceae bacterium LTM1]|nr:HutD family protein [Porticoccaceae bacterium LTM1]
MPSHLIAATRFLHNRWDGGTTTELLIGPQGSTLAARDFDVRISCARVEQSGAFSDFSGYQRLLLILNGELTITHRGEIFCLSAAHEGWHFDGGDKVHAELHSPYVDDFNLFVRPGVMKTAHGMALFSGQNWQQAADPDAKTYGVLLIQGSVRIDDTQLDEHHPLMISSSPLTVDAETDARLVVFAFGSVVT